MKVTEDQAFLDQPQEDSVGLSIRKPRAPDFLLFVALTSLSLSLCLCLLWPRPFSSLLSCHVLTSLSADLFRLDRLDRVDTIRRGEGKPAGVLGARGDAR